MGDPRTAFETCSLAVVENVLLLLVVLKSNANQRVYTCIHALGRHYYCAKWPCYAAVPAGTALQRGEARTIRSGNAVCVGAVDREEVVELTLVMAMEVLLDHGKLRNDQRGTRRVVQYGYHRSGLHTATCASMTTLLR